MAIRLGMTGTRNRGPQDHPPSQYSQKECKRRKTPNRLTIRRTSRRFVAAARHAPKNPKKAAGEYQRRPRPGLRSWPKKALRQFGKGESPRLAKGERITEAVPRCKQRRDTDPENYPALAMHRIEGESSSAEDRVKERGQGRSRWVCATSRTRRNMAARSSTRCLARLI